MSECQEKTNKNESSTCDQKMCLRLSRIVRKSVCLCVLARERDIVCVCKREWVCVCMCVLWERVWACEGESVCACVCQCMCGVCMIVCVRRRDRVCERVQRECLLMCVCVCVRERESERERKRIFVSYRSNSDGKLDGSNAFFKATQCG